MPQHAESYNGKNSGSTTKSSSKINWCLYAGDAELPFERVRNNSTLIEQQYCDMRTDISETLLKYCDVS